MPLTIALDDSTEYGNYSIPDDYYMELPAAEDEFG